MNCKASAFVCENRAIPSHGVIRFISRKNRKAHEKELLNHLLQAEPDAVYCVSALAKQLEQELFCYVPLSAYKLKLLVQHKKVWLDAWSAQAFPNNQPERITEQGVWVPATQLPAHAYLYTGGLPGTGLPELTRLEEAGWHLACYHYALRWAKQWAVQGPPGWLTLSDASPEQAVFVPQNSGQFLRYWLRRHAVCEVRSIS